MSSTLEKRLADLQETIARERKELTETYDKRKVAHLARSIKAKVMLYNLATKPTVIN